MFRLEDLGWSDFFQQQLNSEEFRALLPARIAEANRGDAFRIYAESGTMTATISGRLRHETLTRGELPAAGDWVLADLPSGGSTVIQRLLDRRTKLSRKEAGDRTGEQVLAANIDIVFLVAALNQDFNPRRIERYLAAIWQSGARPVVLLNKSDLCDEPNGFVRRTETLAPGVEVVATSTVTREGLARVRRLIAPGETAACVGSSGVGKSSLINGLLDEEALAVRVSSQ